MVLVFINLKTEPQPVRLAFGDLQKPVGPRFFTPHTTSDRDNLQAGPPLDVTRGLVLPPGSVVTLEPTTK